MKKIIFIVVLIGLELFIIDFGRKDEIVKNKDELRGIYISYIEFYKHFNNKTNNEIKKEIDLMINNLYTNKFNLIFLHVRPFSDSIYESKIFPYSKTLPINKEKLDVLGYFIEKSHNLDIKVHAWINPYRISNNTNVNEITCDNPCYKWIGTNNIKVIKNKGIYYNPASQEVEDLIVNGVEEIINNYSVDGIHFDDYFYASKDIDKDNYKYYIKQNGNITIEKYRYEVINKMIKRVYSKIKELNKNIIFSIAPDANINNNYNENYADILTWLKEDNYIDYIIPQLYYGFDNSNKPYINTLIEWNNYIKNDTKILPALAFYKIGNEDKYAGKGKNEWIESTNIISNQVKVSRNLERYKGFVLFRYDSYFINTEQVLKEQEELLKIIDLN